MIFRALEFAAKAHRGQYRKGTKIPYLIHPLGVAKILIELGFDETVVVAGVLHDTVEDTKTQIEDIRREFGDDVAEIVKGASEPDKTKPWKDRKEHTIEYLITAPRDVLVVMCADKIDNARTTGEDIECEGESVWQRFNRPKKDQEWYYKSILKILKSRLTDEKGKKLVKLLKYEVNNLFPL